MFDSILPFLASKIPRPQIVLNTSLDHCLQLLIIRFRLLLMNLQVVQF